MLSITYFGDFFETDFGWGRFEGHFENRFRANFGRPDLS
jgi:hypothetical protein